MPAIEPLPISSRGRYAEQSMAALSAAGSSAGSKSKRKQQSTQPSVTQSFEVLEGKRLVDE